jgi:hypothetical protein
MLDKLTLISNLRDKNKSKTKLYWSVDSEVATFGISAYRKAVYENFKYTIFQNVTQLGVMAECRGTA